MAGRPTGLLSEWLKSVRDGTDLKGCRTKHDICSLPPSPLPHALLPGTAAFAGGFSPRFSRKRSTTTALTCEATFLPRQLYGGYCMYPPATVPTRVF